MAKMLKILCRAQNVVYNVVSISKCELVGMIYKKIYFKTLGNFCYSSTKTLSIEERKGLFQTIKRSNNKNIDKTNLPTGTNTCYRSSPPNARVRATAPPPGSSFFKLKKSLDLWLKIQFQRQAIKVWINVLWESHIAHFRTATKSDMLQATFCSKETLYLVVVEL